MGLFALCPRFTLERTCCPAPDHPVCPHDHAHAKKKGHNVIVLFSITEQITLHAVSPILVTTCSTIVAASPNCSVRFNEIALMAIFRTPCSATTKLPQRGLKFEATSKHFDDSSDKYDRVWFRSCCATSFRCRQSLHPPCREAWVRKSRSGVADICSKSFPCGIQAPPVPALESQLQQLKLQRGRSSGALAV